MRHPRRLAGLLLGLVFATRALAQTGGLEVVVTDAESKAPLPGATVLLTSATQQIPATALTTDAAGKAVFPVLRGGGGYAVEVRMAGYATLRIPDLKVSLGKTAVLPVGLFPELRESVGVSAKREGVALDETGAKTTLSSEFIEDLPIRGRFYQTLLTLAPGVLDSDEDGNPNVHGSRVTDFKTQVGGVANTDPLTGGFLSYINLESVDALEIVTSGAGAEFGRAQGGFANIVQKQGTNSFEGLAGILWNTSKLDGNGASDAEIEPYDWVQPFLQLSGPIVRDRLWYRLSHEWIDKEEPINLLTQVAVIERKQGIHSDQITWQVSPRNKLTLQYQQDPLRVDGQGVTTYVPVDSATTFERGGTTTTATWTAPYSARLFFEGLAAWQDHEEKVIPTTIGVQNDCVISTSFPNLPFAQCRENRTGFVTGSAQTDSRDHRQRFTVHGQATLFLGSGGSTAHQIKAGFGIENERYFRTLSRGAEMDFVIPLFQGLPAKADTSIHVPNVAQADTSGTSVGLFAEDQIQLGPRLTVTAGLRFDLENIDGRAKEPIDARAEAERFAELRQQGLTIPEAFRGAFTGFEGGADFTTDLALLLGTPETSAIPLDQLVDQSRDWRKRRFQNIELRNQLLSPRLAVAWDPFGTGKTKLAATAGRYYDKIFLSVPLLAAEAPTSLVKFVADRTGQGFLVTRAESIVPNARVTVVDPNLRTPYQDELTVSAERELLPETSIKATWVRRRFRDQLQDVDLNRNTGDYGACHDPTALDRRLLVPSEGEGQQLVDPVTGAYYTDTDPGPGDGRLDDCTGNLHQPGGIFSPFVLSPDGLPDLYSYNPMWGQIMLVTNANTADYSAVVLELIRRHAQGWEMNGSYTWSRAIGDAEAYDQLLGDDPSALQEERTYLSYDQRHVVKLTGAVDLRSAWRMGGTLRFESGLPYSEVETVDSYVGHIPTYELAPAGSQLRYRYVNGKRNDQRNRGFWNLDFRLARDFPLRGGATAGISMEVFNAFNDDTLRILQVTDGRAEGVRRFGRRFQVGLRTSF
ncbi:MAG TPA: TonB-dependent receptor [Candidatus Polarisedimenticolaceae bacterium]|nr:TonB-dependent receptor [Candidatus Polarisedimenticolaceae bacterium]